MEQGEHEQQGKISHGSIIIMFVRRLRQISLLQCVGRKLSNCLFGQGGFVAGKIAFVFSGDKEDGRSEISISE